MMTNNDEWRIIGASALGGGFGAVVGVFLAVFSTAGNAVVWQVLAMRWAANFLCALLFGGPAALYLNSISFISNGSSPGPILCLASGGCMGIGGVALLQIFMPLILKWMERKWDSATRRVWSDTTTPPKNPPDSP